MQASEKQWIGRPLLYELQFHPFIAVIAQDMIVTKTVRERWEPTHMTPSHLSHFKHVPFTFLSDSTELTVLIRFFYFFWFWFLVFRLQDLIFSYISTNVCTQFSKQMWNYSSVLVLAETK